MGTRQAAAAWKSDASQSGWGGGCPHQAPAPPPPNTYEHEHVQISYPCQCILPSRQRQCILRLRKDGNKRIKGHPTTTNGSVCCCDYAKDRHAASSGPMKQRTQDRIKQPSTLYKTKTTSFYLGLSALLHVAFIRCCLHCRLYYMLY